MTLDDIRARRWGFAVYALDPSDPVTLEVHVNGETYTWEGATVAACLVAAFGKPVVSRDPIVAGSQPAPLLLPPESAPVGTGGQQARVVGSPETTGSVFD